MKYIIAGSLILALIPPGICIGADAEKEDHICFMRIDKDKDGQMSYEEFIPFYGKKRAVFDEMDDDKNGSVSHDEYEAFLYDSDA